MIVNLDQVSFATVEGMRLELHFQDGGSHMRSFCSLEELIATIEEWKNATSVLNSASPRPA
jgi:hypothetical protein